MFRPEGARMRPLVVSASDVGGDELTGATATLRRGGGHAERIAGKGRQPLELPICATC
jgi:hypothetical protein